MSSVTISLLRKTDINSSNILRTHSLMPGHQATKQRCYSGALLKIAPDQVEAVHEDEDGILLAGCGSDTGELPCKHLLCVFHVMG